MDALLTRTAIKVAVTIVAVVVAPAIARSRLIVVPRHLVNDPEGLAAFRRVVTFVLRLASVVLLTFSLLYQRIVDAHTPAPALIASGALTASRIDPADSTFTISGTINGVPFPIVVDYGSNGTALTEHTFDALHLPHPYANATRKQKIVLRQGVDLVLDSTANAVVQVGDTITLYWGDFEPMLLDSLRIGTSLQPHMYLAGAMSSSIYAIDALIGRDVVSQFDIEFDGPGHTVRFYARPATDSSVHAPPWLPAGLRASDCLRAVVVGPNPIPAIEPSDTASLSAAEKQQLFDGMAAARRIANQIELKFPVTVDGHAIDATFDSGTPEPIINWAEARVLGITPSSPRIRPDSVDKWAWEVSNVVVRLGGQALPSPRVWITDLKFSGDSSYKTKPMIFLGLRQFRDRVLFMSHSTGNVCVNQPANVAKR